MNKVDKIIDELKKKISPEFKLVLQLSNPKLSDIDNKKIDKLLRKDIDWEKFYELAFWEGLFPIVYVNSKKLKKIIPENILRKLKIKYRENAMRMMFFKGELSRLLEVMRDEKIEPIILKGISNAISIYGDINLRKSHDIDMLIDLNNFKKAHDLLISSGYKRIEPSIELSESEMEIMLKTNKHAIYYSVERRVTIELHWRTTVYKDRESVYNDLIARAEEMEVDGIKFLTLGYMEKIIHLLIHGSKHIWAQKRWLNDINWLYKKGGFSNIDVIIKRFEAEKSLDVLIQTFIFLKIYYDIDIPVEIKEIIDINKKGIAITKEALKFNNMSLEDRKKALSKNKIMDKIWRRTISYRIKFINGYPSKVKFIFDLFFEPTIADIKLIRLPKKLCFLYFFIRPVRGFLKFTKLHIQPLIIKCKK